MYKTIIIGCGKIGGIFDEYETRTAYNHARAYSNNNRIEVVGFVDVDITRAKKLADRYRSLNFGNNYMEFINQCKPDVVSICTPDHTHFEIMSTILKNTYVPKILFVEKPVCSNWNELIMLKKYSAERDVIVLVNHVRRFDPKHRSIKSFLKRNKLGRLIRTDVFYYGGWKHIGVHAVDILRYLFEDELEITAVNGFIPSLYNNDPVLDTVLHFKGGKSTVYFHAFDEKYYQIYDIDLKFEGARLRIEDFGNRIIFERKIINNMNENVLIEDDLKLSSTKSPMQNAIDMIVDCLDSGDKTLIGDWMLDEVEKTMKIIWEGAERYENQFI